MSEPMDLWIQLDKRSERREFQNLACNHLAYLVFLDCIFPRVFLQPFQGQTDAVVVDGDDLGPDMTSNLHDVFGIFDPLPSQLRDMDQSLELLAELHESAEIHHACDLTLYHVADGELADFLHEFVFHHCPFRDNQLFAILFGSDNPHIEILTNETAQYRQNLVFIAILHARIVRGCELRYRQKADHAVDLYHQSAFVGFQDLGAHDFAAFHLFTHGLPHALESGLAE